MTSWACPACRGSTTRCWRASRPGHRRAAGRPRHRRRWPVDHRQRPHHHLGHPRSQRAREPVPDRADGWPAGADHDRPPGPEGGRGRPRPGRSQQEQRPGGRRGLHRQRGGGGQRAPGQLGEQRHGGPVPARLHVQGDQRVRRGAGQAGPRRPDRLPGQRHHRGPAHR